MSGLGDQGPGAPGEEAGQPPAAAGPGTERGPRPQLLLALAAAGFVAFNFPMLIVWDADVTVLGLPLLPVALFAVWAALVALLALASERRPRPAADLLSPPPGVPGAGG